MNLGIKLAVGEAVDTGIDPTIGTEIDPAPAARNAQPSPAGVVVVAPEEPVAAHAEG